MVVERDDLDVLVGEELLPGVSFVGGLPDGVVFQADEDGLRVLEVCELPDPG